MATRDEVYAKFGITAEAAQLFETELGTLLLAARGLEKGWHISSHDGKHARAVVDDIDRSTLGKLLATLRKYIKLSDDLDDRLVFALKARNRLIHGFFERHNFKIQTWRSFPSDTKGRLPLVARASPDGPPVAGGCRHRIADGSRPKASLLLEPR